MGEFDKFLDEGFLQNTKRSFIKRGISEQEADDCTQDLAVRLLMTRTKVTSLKAYAKRAADSVYIDTLRKKRVKRNHISEIIDVQGPDYALVEETTTTLQEPDPEEIFIHQRETPSRRKQIVYESLWVLSERQRDIFVRELQGEPRKSIAATYAISVENVGAHIDAAVGKIKKNVQNHPDWKRLRRGE
jgi:RNA polymerase sigma factor (sigma-70 family)